MTYTTSFKVRQISGLTEDELADSVLDSLIEYAEAEVQRQINVRAVDEDLNPNLDGTGIDGENKTFYTKHFPIADVNKDSVVDSNDITVYVWDDEQDENTKTVVGVDSVTADSGRIVLTTAPSSDSERISADYSYHLNPIDYSLVSKACDYLTAYLCVLRKHDIMPVSYTLGRSLKVQKTKIGERLYQQYLVYLNMLRPVASKVVHGTDIVQARTHISYEM